MKQVIIHTGDDELLEFLRHPESYRFVNLSVAQARDLTGTTEEWLKSAELDSALDEAQGDVFGGDTTLAYVVIRIGQ